MKKSLLFVASLLVVVLLATNCDIFGGKEDCFPMGVGSTWNYEGYALMTTSVAGTDTIQTSTTETEATKEDKLTTGEGVVEFVSTTTIHMKLPAESTFTWVDTSYVQKTDEQILSYSSKDDTNPMITIALPLEQDKTWQVTSNTTARVIAKEDVTVAAGTYKNCWKLELTTTADAGTSTMYYWYADGTGSVQTHMESENQGTTLVMHSELSSATIR